MIEAARNCGVSGASGSSRAAPFARRFLFREAAMTECNAPHDHRFIDMTGRRYGRLLVVGLARRDRPVGFSWHCKCDCGGVSIVAGGNLRTGHTRSCGCLESESRGQSQKIHGEGCKQTTEFRLWINIKTRCYNPRCKSFKYYGGRGISMCDAWRFSYPQFLADMGRRPSPEYQIDRIDNAGNYEPGNCRWATRKEQARNKRSNRLFTVKGETLCLSAWAEKLGLCRSALYQRFRRMSIERALTIPDQRGQHASL